MTHVAYIERVELIAYQLKGLVELSLISGMRVERKMHHMRVGHFLRRPS